MRTFNITYFNKLYNNKGEFYNLSLQELWGFLSNEFIVPYKDNAPGFIAGALENNSKEVNNKVLSRSCLVIDFDHITNLDEWFSEIDNLLTNKCYMLYTSFSHSEENSKVRVVIPLLRDVCPELYEDFITNVFCYSLNKEIAESIDKTTYQAKRFMFCHSHPEGKKGFTYIHEGEELLDISWYPYGKLSKEKISYEEYESLYPDYKTMIEEFNKKYSGDKVYGVIKDEEYIEFFNSLDVMWFIKSKLSKVYTDNYKNRFKYKLSSSGMCGAVVYNNTLFSNHGSDPACNGHTHGCFSLLKIHLCDNVYVSALNYVKRLLNYRLYE